MNGRRMRHVCSMKGCRNRDVMLVSKNEELGGGLYLCKECITELQRFKPYFEDEKVKAKKEEAPKAEVEEAKEEAPKTSGRRIVVPKSGKGDK